MMIYLAGPIFGCSDEESSDWRQEVKNGLDECRNHLGFKRYGYSDPFDRDLRGMEDFAYKTIVEGDKEMMDNCDYLLVGLWKISAGTMMEILYAWENGKKVFVINGLDKISPWIKYHSYAIFNNIDQAIDYFKRA